MTDMADHLAAQRHALVSALIERNPALARAIGLPDQRQIIRPERGDAAGRQTCNRFNLHNIGTKLGQQMSSQKTAFVGEVEHAKPGEGQFR